MPQTILFSEEFRRPRPEAYSIARFSAVLCAGPTISPLHVSCHGGVYYEEGARASGPPNAAGQRMARRRYATINTAKGLEVSWDVPTRLIPGYQHIWNPLAAAVVKNERAPDIFLFRVTFTW